MRQIMIKFKPGPQAIYQIATLTKELLKKSCHRPGCATFESCPIHCHCRFEINRTTNKRQGRLKALGDKSAVAWHLDKVLKSFTALDEMKTWPRGKKWRIWNLTLDAFRDEIRQDINQSRMITRVLQAIFMEHHHREGSNLLKQLGAVRAIYLELCNIWYSKRRTKYSTNRILSALTILESINHRIGKNTRLDANGNKIKR